MSGVGSCPPNDRSERYETRRITAGSPHFRLLDCWGVWDNHQRDYVRRPNNMNEVRRFYVEASAEAFRRSLVNEVADLS